MDKEKSKTKPAKESVVSKTKIDLKLKILFIFLGILLSLLIIEMILRVIPKKITKIDFAIASDNRLFDYARGFKYKPNSARNWTSLGPPTIWYFNNFGFRDRPIETTKLDTDVYKIEFIGDSIAMGLGVEEDQAIPWQLEKKLYEATNSGSKKSFLRVYNLSLWAEGPLQYLGVMKDTGVKLKPNLVIVTDFVNDSSDDFVFDKEKKFRFFKAVPDTIIPYPLNEWLKNNSFLYLAFITRYYTFLDKFKYQPSLTEEDLNYGWLLNGQAINQIKELAKKSDAKFLLIGVPAHRDVKNNTNNQRTEKIKDYIADKYHIQYFDLEEKIKSYPKLDELYLDNDDPHFSPRGNQVVATWIVEYLKNNHLVP